MQNDKTTPSQFSQWLIPARQYLLFSLILLIPASPATSTFWIFILAMASTYKHEVIFDFRDRNILFFVLALVLVIGIGFSSNPLTSTKISLKMLFGFLGIYGVAKYIAVYSLLDDSRLKTFCVLATILLLIAILITYYSCYGNPVTCGFDTLINDQNKWSAVILILICAYSAVWSLKWSWIYFFSALGLIILTWALQGRGASITALLIVAIALLLIINNRSRQTLALLIALIASISGLFYIHLYYPKYLTLDYINTLITGRIELWNTALFIIKEHPWLGIGIGTWRRNDEVIELTPVVYDEISPHNFVLELVVSVGIIGSVAFIVFIAILIKSIQRAPLEIAPVNRRFGLLILLAILINGMVDFRLFGPQFIAISGIGLLMWRGGITK